MSASDGQRVTHPSQGSGTILESNGSTIKVKFDNGAIVEVASNSVSQILHS